MCARYTCKAPGESFVNTTKAFETLLVVAFALGAVGSPTAFGVWGAGLRNDGPRPAVDGAGSEAGSYLRRIDSCITQLKAQGPSRTCNESKEERERCWRSTFNVLNKSPPVRLIGTADHKAIASTTWLRTIRSPCGRKFRRDTGGSYRGTSLIINCTPPLGPP